MTRNKFTHTLSWLALILYLISVALLCLLDFSNGPAITIEWFGIPTDKIAHFIMFFPYPILMCLVFGKTDWSVRKFLIFLTIAVIIGAISGGVIELLQAETGYRSCDRNDFRADCLGIAAGALVTLFVWNLTRKKSSNESENNDK